MNKLLKIVTQTNKERATENFVANDLIARENPTVSLHDIKINASLGLYEHERDISQPVTINVDASLIEIPSFGQVKAVNDVVNCEDFARYASDVANDGHTNLMEDFADKLAGKCFANPIIDTVTIEIKKEHSPTSAGNARFKSTYSRMT